MVNEKHKAYRISFDRVAKEYSRRIFEELQHKPLDRQLLDRFSESVRDVGPACDMGCGPGHVARYLHDRGVRVCGIDLSPEMLQKARELNPTIEFREGNMMTLDIPDATWAGITAFYSIIHIPRANVVQALSELRRVLRPGGLLLLAFHIGDDVVHLDEWWGEHVCVDFFFFRSAEMAAFLTAAGFEIIEIIERAPYLDAEHQSRRSYILARRAEAR